MASPIWQPLWRWPVYALATLVVLFAAYWCLAGIMAGGYMGWSGRSSWQVTLIVAVLLLTLILASGLAFRAIVAAKDRRRPLALTSVILSLLPLAAAWLLLAYGWL